MISYHTMLYFITVHISFYIKEESVTFLPRVLLLTLSSWLFFVTLSFSTINLSVTLSGSRAFVPALLTFSRGIYEVFVLIYHTMTRPL